ncbi:MAG: amino acid permease [Alphaproteobacteria bacterium]|nr:MAG: amino acid permease [Alphaproteobacteria bacterium]
MTDDPSPQAGRALGFWLALALIVGNFIGSGIFLLPAQLAPYGWNGFFGWVVTIAGALCLAYVFGRLARAMPLAPGPFAYVERAFGALPAFVVTWSYWISIIVGNAALGAAAVSYLSLFAPGLAGVPGAGALAAISIVWALTAANCVSVRAGGGIQTVTVLAKLVPLIVVIAVTLIILAEGRQDAAPALRGSDLSLGSISAAATLTLWALLGVECASVAARNVRDPGRNIPRATMIGTLVVGLIYISVSSAVAMLLPQGEVAQSNAPIALFVSYYWSDGLALFVGLFAAVSCIGALNGFIMLQGEMPLLMARSGGFPAWFSRTTSDGIPVRAHILSSLCTSLLLAANYSSSLAELFQFMILLSTSSTLVLYLACSLTALRLQQVRAIPFSGTLALIALLGAVYSVWTLAGAGKDALKWGAVLLVVGGAIYAIMRLTRPSEPAATAPESPGSAA